MDNKLIENLKNWQENTFESVETGSDIRVFNVIATIIGLLTSNYMSVGTVHVLIFDVLSLSEEEKERIHKVYTAAYKSASEEVETNE